MSARGFARHGKAAIFGLTLILMAPGARAHSQAVRSFTVGEEIGLAHFLDPFYSEAALVSPNGRFVALEPAERGLSRRDRVEDELRVYDIEGLRHFVQGGRQARGPPPVLDLRESTYREGPIMSQIEWLPDSTGVAFLLKNAKGRNQLECIILKQK